MTQDRSPQDVAVVALPGRNDTVGYYQSPLEVLLRGEVTGGKFLMTRQQGMPAELAPPFHVHTREDEIWIVDRGTFRFWLGGTSLDTAEVRDVGPGGVVYGPRDLPHTFQSLDGPGDVTILWSPAQSQEYFLSVGDGDRREDSEHAEALARVGVFILDRAPVDGR
ncbi:cupin domain-containing protein [Solicola sp. PLA-1-18]|uniref:cupin domain-containing protein n=1 Tax=Solicola sp. PLA-1-18 TaxID=3380532 RepID=UPI003B7DA9F9